uniref:Lysoplasmalogenase n=1 Tax=Paramoeba aestuarina TaxID=180227 RepID=A0A7S4PLV8_9EUKA|mmetsp:Transcript_8469/g.12808  ORF Transcript_8469/g.12808 Transcript_8469/m.12808 type:complete len:229 (+) Transcript_8469:30-716(+)|eukprot:CAMPEP_0201508314 /NCGR_PEP_ID=MMETSP0161_2-20130828/1724_1 /ASSEMBLY_ACC=CAM_ASM_000251 /TAXON_ID=180227 /ORGANISM="Neoparamoeba aestuarina, Strain SoJaBio B1-5/56/2" /LENGTH=228 /DNA_ID=CAMNT_0047902945 /DNA_START=27 /DNA_END=713 /DNA_ORIENTATION=-
MIDISLETSLWITLLGLIGLLFAEAQDSLVLRWATKPFASTGFLLIAVSVGALDGSLYGQMVFAALVLSWFGDMFLIPKAKLSFLFGLISFLSGHVGYVVAFFWGVGFDSVWGGASLLGMVPVSLFIASWLKPHATKAKMWGPVLAYIVVITSMVVCAFGAYPISQNPLIPIGAVLFYLSDIAVARQRFVTPAVSNRMWGLPFYYGGQVILALSIDVYAAYSLLYSLS